VNEGYGIMRAKSIEVLAISNGSTIELRDNTVVAINLDTDVL
jgi:hypothetical protein